MAPNTRSTTSSPAKKPSIAHARPSESKHDPVKILITSKHITEEARLLSLSHPRDGAKKRFLFCPTAGLHELLRTTVHSSDPRSTIFAADDVLDASADSPAREGSLKDGFVNKDAEILTATPFDIAFVLLGSIAPREIPTGKKALFQSIEDLLESSSSEDKGLAYVTRSGSPLIEDAMSRICDTVDAGDEKMFRYDEQKVIDMMFVKARAVVKTGFPTSLEERFVTRVLEAPVLSIRRENVTTSVISEPTVVDDAGSQNDSVDSQSSTASTTVSAVFSETATTVTDLTTTEDDIPADVKHLQRLRTAYNYIAASYLPPYLSKRIGSALPSENCSVNFEPLDTYLSHLATLRAEAAMARSITDFSRKRGMDDDEAAETRAEKKRRQEEEEKKKKMNESRGVRDLKKVNVTGMKKMSDFFSKKPVTATAKAKS